MSDKFKNLKVKINGNTMEVGLEVLLESNLNTSSYNDGWPKRDSISVNSDPIGDIAEDKDCLDALRYMCSSIKMSDQEDFGTFDPDEKDPYVESYKKWKKDQDEYDKMMTPRLIVPEGKMSYGDFEGFPDIDFEEPIEEPKCNCGTFAVYGKVPLKAHAHYCKLVRGQKK